jgi:uncharacterized BrkB/YihY/UPF0761 family membrane protein
MPDPDPAPEPTSDRAVARGLRGRTEDLRRRGVTRLETEMARRPSVQIGFDLFTRDRAFAGSLLAGGLAVKLFLWILPFSLLVVVILGSLSERLDRPAEDLASTAGLTAAMASLVSDAVINSSRARLYLGALAVVLMIWAGMAVVRAARLISRLAWGLPKPPPVNVVAGSLALAGFMTAFVVIQWGTGRLFGGPPLVDALVFAVNTALTISLLMLLLDTLPRPSDAPWTALIPAGLLLTVGFVAIRLTTILYFAPRLETSGDLYGGLGLATVFLAWLYVISRTLVAALSLSATMWLRRLEPADATLRGASGPRDAPALTVDSLAPREGAEHGDE